MNDDTSKTPGVLAPPPFLFLGALIAGFTLNALISWPLLPLRAVGAIAGGTLIATGLSLSFAVTRLFHRAGTPVSALQPSRHLVVLGPYRFSRNPDYLGQTLIYCGCVLLFNSVWLFLTLLPALLLVRYGVIAREERYLEKLFGEEYRRYCQRVRRWL